MRYPPPLPTMSWNVSDLMITWWTYSQIISVLTLKCSNVMRAFRWLTQHEPPWWRGPGLQPLKPIFLSGLVCIMKTLFVTAFVSFYNAGTFCVILQRRHSQRDKRWESDVTTVVGRLWTIFIREALTMVVGIGDSNRHLTKCRLYFTVPPSSKSLVTWYRRLTKTHQTKLDTSLISILC